MKLLTITALAVIGAVTGGEYLLADTAPGITGVIYVQKAGYEPEMFIFIDENGGHTAIRAGELNEQQAEDVMELVKDDADWGRITVTCDVGT